MGGGGLVMMDSILTVVSLEIPSEKQHSTSKDNQGSVCYYQIANPSKQAVVFQLFINPSGPPFNDSVCHRSLPPIHSNSRLMILTIASLDLDAVSTGRASLRGPGASKPTLKLHPDGLLSPLGFLHWIPTGFEILAPLAISVRVGVSVTGDAQFDDVIRQTLDYELPESLFIHTVTGFLEPSADADSGIQALQIYSIHLGNPRGADDMVHLGGSLCTADSTHPGDLDSEPPTHQFTSTDYPHYVHLYGKVFSMIQQIVSSPSVSLSQITAVEVVA